LKGKQALKWTRLSCHRYLASQVRLALFILAYNLGNFLPRVGLPRGVRDWSLRSVQVKLIKVGGRVVRHARRLVFQLAEVAVSRELFQGVLRSGDRSCGDGRSLPGHRALHAGPMREHVPEKEQSIIRRMDRQTTIGAPTHHAHIINKGAVTGKKH